MLNHGYAVRGTLRDLGRAEQLTAMFERQNVNSVSLQLAYSPILWLAHTPPRNPTKIVFAQRSNDFGTNFGVGAFSIESGPLLTNNLLEVTL